VCRALRPPCVLPPLGFRTQSDVQPVTIFLLMQNPLRSEDAMFRFLVWIGGVVVVLIVLVVVLRAIF
jgi:hypothetical protein